MKPIRPFTAVAALVAALAIGAGTAAVVTTAMVDDAEPTTRQVTVTNSIPAASSDTGGSTINAVYEQTHESVVEITTTGSRSNQFGGSQQALSQGTGWVYDAAGHIVTNQHVVDGADSVSVTFSNGASFDGRIVGTDPSTDLAVIKIDAPEALLKPLQLADSSTVEVGEGVVAIGSPFGLEQTVTAGIVSALHRAMEAPNGFTINDSIQTDAPINSGNSGGPLLNLDGQVIGVNSQIESRNNGNVGVGFAVPSNTVRSIAPQLIETGEVEHAYLGVGVQEISESVARELGVPAGVALTEVRRGTPAAKAGLKGKTGDRVVNGVPYATGGDIVTEIDGRPVTSSADLQGAIDAKQPGDVVTLTLVRGGDEREVEVTLAERPEQAS